MNLSTTDVRMRLLGPVSVLADGEPCPVRGLRRNAVLAALALPPGEPVSAGRLVDIVWGDGAPRTAVDTLRNHVAYLRRVLDGRVSILARSAGYILDLGGGTTDAEVAEHLIRHAEQSGDPYERRELLQAAVALWQGPSLGDLADLGWFSGHAQRLDQLHRHARQLLVDARLELGEHRPLIPELEELGREHPLDEHVHGQLMLALYRSGRQADALAIYQRIRDALDDELGVVPGAALQDLEVAILRQSPDLTPPPPPAPTAAGGVTARVVPAQLPAAITPFTGRGRELAVLDERQAGSWMASGPVVAAISGIAGVGKTTLAVYWAHRAAPEFPDGQLYLNLRGYHVSGSPLATADALHHLLISLGVPAGQIPAQPEAQIGLYRSIVSGRKILVLLDNARDADQVRPLLPGSPGCVVIVTSRNQLTSLAVTSGAHLLGLEPLSAAEAGDLISRRLGADRVAAEPDAIEALASPSAGLPLALAITAARASAHPHFPLGVLAAQLHDTGAGLGRFHGGDPDTDLRAVFSWSYHALSPDAARTFRRLSLHPGTDISTAAAASLAAEPAGRARTLLTELADAHLITEHAPGRYSLHDLLRAFAAELAGADDSEAERHAATHRVLDHYLHSAHAASEILGQPNAVDLAPARPGVTSAPLSGRDQATGWYAAECQSVVAAVERAAATGFDTHVWQLARVCRWYLHRHAMWSAQIVVQQLAVHAARRLHEPTPEGYALLRLAATYAHTRRLDDAQAHFEQASRLFGELDDPIRQGHAYHGTANVQIERGDVDAGLRSARRAFELYELVGYRSGQASALNTIGSGCIAVGHYEQAIDHCRQALDLEPESDMLAHTWDTLGYAYHCLGDHDQSVSCYQASLEWSRTIDDRGLEVRTLNRLADAHDKAGYSDLAARVRDQARAIVEQLDRLG